MNKHIETIGGIFEGCRADAAPKLGALDIADGEVWSHVNYYIKEISSMGGMHVTFSEEVDVRPIAWANNGRKAGTARKTPRAASSTTTT